jgi:serine protease Do
VAYLPPAETGAANIGFAIPSDTAISVADQLIETGRATQPYLGIGLEEITPEDAERFGIPGGVLVTDVERGGPSDEAGLQQGDVITAAGSVETASYGDLLGALRTTDPATPSTLLVRDGDEREIEVELGERPQQ